VNILRDTKLRVSVWKNFPSGAGACVTPIARHTRPGGTRVTWGMTGNPTLRRYFMTPAGRNQRIRSMLPKPDTSPAPVAPVVPFRLVERTGIDAAQLLQLQSSILSQERFAAAATAFATELAILMHADRVAIGFLERSQTRVVAVSHTVTFQAYAEQFSAIGAAMDEALEQQASIRHPDSPEAKPRITAAHAALTRREGGAVASIPMVDHGVAFGALTLTRREVEAFSDEEIAQCEQISRSVGPILRLKRDNEQSWTSRLNQTLRSSALRLVEPGNLTLKAGLGSAVLALAALTFIPVDFRVGAPARIEGAIQRALVAPVDGFLRELHARPGDHVKTDQVLAELAQEDLRLDQRKWESELAQHENAASAALARSDRAQFVVAQARAEEARAQLELANSQLARTRLVAPFDGIVIAGDLTQSLGAPVQRGQTLLTVAPDQQFRLLIEVDERDIDTVQTGSKGSLVLGALIGRSLPFTVARITPMATSRDGRNFFEVEGRFDGVPSDLRPGLQGVAKIEAGSRTTAWIWTHRFTEWLRLTAWSWGN